MRGAVFVDHLAEVGRPVGSPMVFAMEASERDELAVQIPAADSWLRNLRRDEMVASGGCGVGRRDDG